MQGQEASTGRSVREEGVYSSNLYKLKGMGTNESFSAQLLTMLAEKDAKLAEKDGTIHQLWEQLLDAKCGQHTPQRVPSNDGVILQYEGKIVQLERKLAGMETQQVSASEYQLKASEDAVEASRQLEAAGEEIEYLHRELQEATMKLKGMQVQLDAATGEVESLRQESDGAQAHIHCLNQQLVESQGQVDENRKKLDDMNAVLAQCAKREITLKREVDKLQSEKGQVANIEQKLRSDYENKVASLLSFLDGQSQQRNQEINRLTKQLTEATRQISAAKEDSKQQQRKTEVAIRELKEAREENAKMQRLLLELKQERHVATVVTNKAPSWHREQPDPKSPCMKMMPPSTSQTRVSRSSELMRHMGQLKRVPKLLTYSREEKARRASLGNSSEFPGMEVGI